jgi:hypothetical protein
MIYFGSRCVINNCNICYNYIHEANYFNCNYCGGDVDDWKMKCIDCGDTEELYFECNYCDEEPNVGELCDICNTFIDNINIIKKWYKNIKRNKILWKIANYYTQKKYNPQSKFMIEYIQDENNF